MSHKLCTVISSFLPFSLPQEPCLRGFLPSLTWIDFFFFLPELSTIIRWFPRGRAPCAHGLVLLIPVSLIACLVPGMWLFFSCQVVSKSLWSHGDRHARLPCPSLSPRLCSRSCPWSRWCHLNISSWPLFSPFTLSLSQHQGLFQWVGSSHQVAKVWELQLQHHSF